MITWTVKLIFHVVPKDGDAEVLTDLLPAGAATLINGKQHRTEILLAIRSGELDEAFQRSLKLAEVFSPLLDGRSPDAVEVLSEKELEHRNGQPRYPRVCGIREIADKAHITSTRASELAQSGGFPEPIGRLASGPVFAEEEVDAFIARWERRPGRPRKVA